MPDFTQIRNYPLKVIFILHFVGIGLSSFGFWSSSAYLYYNAVLIFTILWAIKENSSEEPLQMAIVVNASCILLDILLLVMGFPESSEAREKFSAAMAILHLVLRPFTTIYMVKMLDERGGLPGRPNTTGGHTGSYEDIDRNVPSNQPQPHGQSGSYDFSGAQRI